MKNIFTNIDEYLKENNIEENLNDNFWKWFGNSKVVNKNHEPLVVYHGTDNKFDVFKKVNMVRWVVAFI